MSKTKEKFRFKTTPYQHQKKCLELFGEAKHVAFLMEQGTGKTKVTLDNLTLLHDQKKINAAIIIAPKGVCGNWAIDEIPTHLAIDDPLILRWKPDKVNTKKYKEEFNEFFVKVCSGEKFGIFIVNIDGFSTGKLPPIIKKVLSLKNFEPLIAIDESTTIKHHKSTRSKNVHALFPERLYKRILTGTPITNKPLDAFSQYLFLNPKILGYSSWTAFRARYAKLRLTTMKGRTFYEIEGWQNLDELSKKIQPYSFRVTKAECLDLPKKIYQKRRVELTKEQRKFYDQMKKELFMMEGGEVLTSANNTLVKLLKLQQITCGFYTDEKGIVHEIPGGNPKLEEMMDLIEDVDGKIIIWANYVYSIKKIKAALSEVYGENSVVDFYGATSDEDRDLARKRFQNDPTCRFFISNVTGSRGLTLTASHYTIYFSNSHDIEMRQQSEDRNHRIGQEMPVIYMDIIAEDTVDETIVRSLKNKVHLQNLILKEHWTKLV